MAITRIGNIADTIPNSSVQNVKMSNIVQSKNIIINGDMSIAQRGTSTASVTSTDGYYTCDRWYSQTDTGTWTISQSTDVPTGQGFFNSFKMDCTSAGSSNADEVMIRSRHEGQNLQYLKYGTSNATSLTLSFWIKSNKTGNYYLAMANANTTQDRVVSFGYTIDSADTWEKKTITIPGDTSQNFDNTNGENLTLYWLFSAAGAFTSGGVSNTWINYAANRFANSDLEGLGGSTSDYVNITGVQLEAGTTASDFEFLPYDVNLGRCYRYYRTIVPLNTANTGFSMAFYTATANGRFAMHLENPMRATPSLDIVTGTNYFKIFSAGGGDDQFNSFSIMGNSTEKFVIANNTTETSGTAGEAGYAQSANNSAYLGFEAEL